MNTAIQIVGGLILAGGFLWMMWGAILILKEAYKDGALWLIGCLTIPIVMAIFVMRNPERVHAGRMTILKSLVPFALGLALLIGFSSSSGNKASAAQPPSAAIAALSKPLPKAAPAPAAASRPAPAAPAAPAAAGRPAPAAPAAPALPVVVDEKTRAATILEACANEVSLYCGGVKRTSAALKACLMIQPEGLLSPCKAALR